MSEVPRGFPPEDGTWARDSRPREYAFPWECRFREFLVPPREPISGMLRPGVERRRAGGDGRTGLKADMLGLTKAIEIQSWGNKSRVITEGFPSRQR